MKKYFALLLIALVMIGFAVATPHLALAQTAPATPQATPGSNLFSCSANLATCTIEFASYIIDLLLAKLVSFGAAIAGVMLNFNIGLFTSPIVQTGFSAMLAFANLGFVLAIIVIALATIIRSETYGMKQVLWKLIAMAVIVNFGLVICAPIVSFSDGLSQFLMQKAGANNAGSLVYALTSAFKPQTETTAIVANNNAAVAGVGGTPTIPSGGTVTNAANGAALGLAASCNFPVIGTFMPSFLCLIGNTVIQNGGVQGVAQNGVVGSVANTVLNDSFANAIVQLIFSAIFLAIIAFTFVAMAALFLVRYVYLSFLLILLPIAWLAWVFPGLDHYFSKWWGNFIRWAFFPPIVLFFLYLALLLAPVGQGGNATAGGTYFNTALGMPTGFVANATTNAGQNVVTQLILCAIAVGGLFAANSLGIAGAEVFVKAGKNAGHAVAGYAGAQAKRGVSMAYQGAGGNKLTAALQSGGGRFGNVLRKIPIAGYVVGRGASLAGQGLSKMTKAGSQDQVEAEMKWAKNAAKDPHEGARLLQGFLPEKQRLALIKAMAGNKDMDSVTNINGRPRDEFLAKSQTTFERYGQGDFYARDLKKHLLFPQLNELAERVAGKINENELITNTRGEQVTVKAVRDELRATMSPWVAGLKKEDAKKMDFGATFNKSQLATNAALKERVEGFVYAVANNNYQLVGSMMSGMKANQQQIFKEMYEKEMSSKAARIDGMANGQAKTDALAEMEKQRRAYEKTLSNIASGTNAGGGGGGAAAPEEAGGH